MVKRALAALLWFIAADSAFNLLNLFLGAPSIVGLVVAVGVGAFIGLDGLRFFRNEQKIEAKSDSVAVNAVQHPVRPTY
jgi:hypothetical protein